MSAVTEALALAEFGIPVFPCNTDKEPLTTHGFYDATVDPEQIAAWWRRSPNALVGYPTGKVSGLLVLDADPKGADWYAENLVRLSARRIHQTRRGHHVVYRCPDPAPGSSTSKIAPGIDVKGDGGYAIWWPAEGLPTIGDLDDVGPPPDWLLEKMMAAKPPSSSTPATSNGTEFKIYEPGRNNWLTQEGGRLRWAGLPHEVLEAELQRRNLEFCVPPLSADDVTKVARSVCRYEEGHEPPPVDPGALLGDEARRLLEVPVSDLLTAEIDPPREIIAGLVYALVVTLLGGHGGAGKSILALILAAHVACGRSWAGFHVIQCPVLYVSLEDGGDLVRYRLRRIVERYELDAEMVANNLRIVDGSHGDASLAVEANAGGIRQLIEAPAMRELEQAAEGAGLIVIDNASDAYGGDENARRQVRWFIRRLARIAVDNDGALMLLAHLDKAGAKFGTSGNSYSGSTAWHNSARSRLALLAGEDGAIQLVHEKNNLGPKAEPVALEWDGAVLIPRSRDRVGESVARALLVNADADAVLESIRIATTAGTMVPAALTGPATAYRALEPFPELGKEFRSKDGRKRLAAAITALLRDDRLRRVEYKDGYRNTKVRLEPTQNTGRVLQ